MRAMLIILVSLLGITTFNSCEKITDTTWVYYNETWCMDSWGNADIEESEKIKNIENYLKKQKIKVFEVNILNDGTMDPCDACHCKSGKRIHCKIEENHLGKALDEGFYQ